jgi:hypothetical protein
VRLRHFALVAVADGGSRECLRLGVGGGGGAATGAAPEQGEGHSELAMDDDAKRW